MLGTPSLKDAVGCSEDSLSRLLRDHITLKPVLNIASAVFRACQSKRFTNQKGFGFNFSQAPRRLLGVADVGTEAIMQRTGGRTKRATDSTPPLGRYYDVERRRLFVHRSGSGNPPVVFLAGAGTVGLDYLNVQEQAAELSTSLLYDRAGTGWSDAVGLPRTLTQVTDELRELLRAASVPAPYVLVGHSLGGLYARNYAQRFPGEIAALLLLDPAHEDWDAYMPRELTEMRAGWSKKQLNRLMNLAIAGAFRSALGRALLVRLPVIRHYRELYRTLFAQEMTDWPKGILEVLIERHASLDWLWVGVQESKNVDQLYDETRLAGPMPDVPLIILCSMGIDGFKEAVSVGVSESLLREEIEGKRRLYTALAESVPRGEVRLVDSGHVTMHLRHPEAVLEALQDLLQRTAAVAR